MMWSSKFFKRSEFACKCGCGFDTVDAELLSVLEALRIELDAPIKIHSGCRCDKRNEQVDGKVRSKHMEGRAADISCDTVSPDTVHAHLCEQYPHKYGIGKYDTFTHIDTRTGCARWTG